MKALIIGASGASGKDLVSVLLQDAAYTEVVLFVRRPSGMQHPKLSEIITDFEQLEAVSQHIRGDVLFCCLGTTLKAAGSKAQQRHIDYEIPAAFAAMAKRNGIATMVLLSAYGAAPESKVFYSRIKGELEAKIAGLAFDRCIIFRPGLLLRRNTDRLGERITAALLKGLNRLGLLRKFRPLPTAILASKMAKAAKTVATGKQVIELDQIFEF